MAKFDKDDSGKLEYSEFLSLMGFKVKRDVESNASDDVDEIVDKLRDRIESMLGSGEKMTKKLKQVARRVFFF